MEAIGSNGRIELTPKKGSEGVYIQVKDDGPGIPPLDRDKIFDPFFTKRNEGTGLGLSVSRKIAESYGGSLRLIKSESGACFEVFLPIELSGDLDEQISSESGPPLDNE